MFKSLILSFFVLTLFCVSSTAAVYTGIEFSEEEKALHLSKIDVLTIQAAYCLSQTYNSHLDFMDKHGVTKFYGNRKYTKGWEPKVSGGRTLIPIRRELQKLGINPDLEDQMENMSCVDYSRRCLKEGFEKAGLSHQWRKIDSFIPNKIGNRLQHALQALGWKMLYWNPDPSKNREWDIRDKKLSPNNSLNVWGYHKARYDAVMARSEYLYNKVDDVTSLVGFRRDQPQFLQSIPFALGTAHAGYHVFLVSYGNAIEAHSTRLLTSRDNLEFSPFNPLDNSNGGGPRWTNSEEYKSGLIVVPPNYLKR